jgi:type I restriction enzyme R subunit
MSPKETFRRRHLPHWDVPGAIYFVTACLEGSIPAQGLLDIRTYQTALARRPRPKEMSESDWELRRWKLVFARAEEWLDLKPSIRHLADAELAGVVASALFFFAGTRYELFSYVVMPSHFHWIFRPLEGWIQSLQADTTKRTPSERIMRSIKRYTSGQCNRRLLAQGRFWQQESYDHWVRDVDELERIINYVEYNPVKAGLARDAKSWRFGSAHYRDAIGLAFGTPLPRTDVG